MMNNERRTERIEARTTPAIRKLMEQAAMLEGRSLSDFVISMASQAAKRTIEEFNTIQLSSRDQQAFAKSLLSPKPVPKALKRAKQRHTDLLGPS